MARLFTIVTVILTLSTVDRSTWAFHACTSEGVGLGCACDSFNTVDCSNRGVKDVPDQVPPDTITLQLNNNKIQGLVENQFPGLSSLLSLDLSNNSISYVEKGAFSALGSLTQLRLSNNKLSSVRAGMFEGMPSLDSLILSSNAVRDIEKGSFVRLPRLTTLDLSNGLLVDIEVGYFTPLANLQTLYLSGNPIQRILNGSFQGLAQLQDLYLIGTELLEIWPETFSGAANIQSLYVRDSKLRRIAPGSFFTLPRLSHLDFRNNALQVIEPGTFTNMPNIMSVDLSYNPLSTLKSFAFNLKGLSTLRVCNLSNARLENVEENALGGEPLCEDFFCDRTLQLDLSNNNLETLPNSFCNLSQTIIFTGEGIVYSLTGNRFSCDCRLRKLVSCIPLATYIRCDAPLVLKHKFLDKISVGNLNCTPPRIATFVLQQDGRNVTMFCNATGFPEPTISWETSASPEGARNKEDAGRQMKGTGTLTISDASSEDGGTYGCTTINPGGRDSRLGYLAFFEVPKESPKTSYLGILPSNLAWCLIGAGIGSFCTLLVSIAVFCICRRRCSESSHETTTNPEGHEMLRVCNETQLEDVDDYGNDDDDDNDYEVPHAHASKLTTPFNAGDRLYQSLGKETRPVSGGPPQRRPPPPPPHRHNSHSHPSHQDYTPLVRGTRSVRV
ncbi:leucine-rich repeat and immunoglobulin-like domain-containing nogo receptor-interacting protein 3 [Branchiostoma lanceolatum]|uniref:leucine-rich repeat and immunoglobulin-like domain-containing nogo receptor-interacting protein 3 n=1 Tax=Branchiostoma lanceolatum TaxID=7740 RepID=UPI003451FBFF